ncbi:MAG TPA: hemerythrin domain-containing protein [Geobacteraceae bacterium]|nr:hemerythrin domain-containing protein [Geobacteraceae bacterium]
MSKAIDDLKHEHEAVLFSLKILKGMVDKLSTGEAEVCEDLLRYIGFLKEFVDKCHHGKEEGILFPAMIKAGLPEKGGPITVMLAEHDQGRGLVKMMETAIPSDRNVSGLAKSAEDYSILLRNHIEKENNILFVMAEKIMKPDALDQIYAAFEEHEEKVIGHGRHEELHGMLKELKEKYIS